MQRTQRTPGLLGRAAAAVLLAMTLGLAGCGSDGDDGAQGPPGPSGEPGEPGTPGVPGDPTDPTQDPLSLAATHAQSLPPFNEAEITAVNVIENNPTNIEITFEVDGYTDDSIAVELTLAKWLPERGTWVNMLQRDVLKDGGVRTIRSGNLRFTVDGGMGGQFITTFNSDSDGRWGVPEGDPIDFSNGAVWRTDDESTASNYCGDDAAYCTFVQGIIDDIEANATWEDRAIYRVGVTSRASAADFRFNTVVDFIPSQGILPDLTNPVMTQASCSSCHGERIAFDGHGGRRFEPAVCTQCHNDFTYDSASSTAEVGGWPNIGAALMVHKIHAGIDGYSVEFSDYSDVRFPDWLFGRIARPDQNPTEPKGGQNCTSCHKDEGEIAAAKWNVVSNEACLTCHVGDTLTDAGFNPPHGNFVGSPASFCANCHGDNPGQDAPSADEFHGVTAALAVLDERKDYRLKIVSVTGAVAGGQPQVAWQVVDGDGTPYPSLLALNPQQLLVGVGWGYGDDWVNDGVDFDVPTLDPALRSNGARGDPWRVVATGTNTEFVGATATTTLPALPDAATAGRNGFAAIYLIEDDNAGLNVNGKVIKPNTAVATLTLGTTVTDPGNERRQIVGAEGCNSCHTTTFRHGTTADADITGCVACHNGGSLNRDGSPVQGSVDFMFMVHGIHGIGEGARERFDRRRPHGYLYVTNPGTILDCQSCHLPGTYAFPVDRDARIGVIADGQRGAFLAGTGVNSAEASVCYSCHENGEIAAADAGLRAHMESFGATMDGTGSHAALLGNISACTGCHTPTN